MLRENNGRDWSRGDMRSEIMTLGVPLTKQQSVAQLQRVNSPTP